MVEYWKEQDAFYRPIEFGLYNPYEVAASNFVEPAKGTTYAPVSQLNAPPKILKPFTPNSFTPNFIKKSLVSAPSVPELVKNPMFLLGIFGIGAVIFGVCMLRRE